MRDQPVLVDLRYLLREERRAPLVVVNSRRAQIDDGDLPVTRVQQRSCVDFGLRVSPGCTDRRLLVDALIGSGGRLMDRHGEGEEELLHLERQEPGTEPAG